MRIATSPSERWLIKRVAEWNPELSSKYRTDQLEDQEKDEKMTSTNSSNKLSKRLKIWPKAATKSIKLGSTQQKTAEDELHSRKNTQRIQKEDMKTMREREEILITCQRGTSMEWNWATKNLPTSHDANEKKIKSKEKWRKELKTWRSLLFRKQTWRSLLFRKPQQLRNQLRTHYPMKLRQPAAEQQSRTFLTDRVSRTTWWVDTQEQRGGLP